MIQDWSAITLGALQDLWQGFLSFTPKLIGAIVVFIVGWLIAVGIGKLIAEILKRLKFNQVFERGDWKEALERADLKINISEFIGAICKWILVIVFLLAAVEILGFVQFAEFLEDVISWLPNLVVAAAIFVVAVIIADISEKLIKAGVEKMKIGYTQVIGIIVKWSIYIFAASAILIQLGIARALIQTLFTGAVIMIALAFGLAFGLGGKEEAREILASLRRRLKREE